MSRYLLDTNILIYYLADAVPPERVSQLPRACWAGLANG